MCKRNTLTFRITDMRFQYNDPTRRQNSVWTMHGRVNRPAQT